MEKYKVRLVPLGGIVGVTKNMYVYEVYRGDKLEDILIVDCGIGFPKEKELGVDFVIPDINYLEDKKEKVRAVLLTHGHEDHTSALPIHYQALGQPPVYASKLTSAFVEAKFKEYGKRLKVNPVDYKKQYQFGSFNIKFIRLTHSIPDTTHILIKTPLGDFYHGSDFKLDLTPPYGSPPDFYSIVKAGEEGVLVLLSDSLGAENEGLTESERIVGKTFEDEMRRTNGKFIMTTFSSNISRIRQCIEAAVKLNRKVSILGRSMRESTEIAREIGYLPKVKNALIRENQVMRQPPAKICLVATGSQGQYDSALSRLANNMNRQIKIKKGDKVVFSSDPIPGSEDDVYDLIERLSLLGAEVVYSDIHDQLHASGHGNQEDLKYLIRFTKPKYLLPIGGTIRHQRQYLSLAKSLGYEESQVILLQEGETFWFERGRGYKGDTVETKEVNVDAYGVGDVGRIILRDRKTLASEGVVFVNLIMDKQGRLIVAPQFVSRGFVYGRDEKDMERKTQREIERVIKPKKGKTLYKKGAKQEIINALEKMFAREIGRKPLVVLEIITV